MLGCTDQVLIRHCRMAHPTYPLLETFYDSKHRAHILVDQGEVSLWTSIDTIIHFHCNSLIILYLCFCPLTNLFYKNRCCSPFVHVPTPHYDGMSGMCRTFAGPGCFLSHGLCARASQWWMHLCSVLLWTVGGQRHIRSICLAGRWPSLCKMLLWFLDYHWKAMQ